MNHLQSLVDARAARRLICSQPRATYERAMGACMEGRGYTVK